MNDILNFYEELATRIAREGGFTLHLMTGESPDTGCAVSLPGREERIEGYPAAATLAAYVARYPDIITSGPTYFGAWHDAAEGVTYLDTTVVVVDRESALYLGHAWGQKAVYDFDTGETVPVPGGVA